MAVTGPGQSPAAPGAFHGMLRWYGLGLLTGVLRLFVAALPGLVARSAGSTVLLVVILLVLVLAGRAARQANLPPSPQAALVGACYAVPAGLVNVLFPPTPAQVAAALRSVRQKLHLTAAQVQLAQRHAASAAAHWESFVFAIFVYVVLGLLLGWIGALFAHRREESRPAGGSEP